MSYLETADLVSPESELIRVLHVDDEPDLASVAAELLERESDRITVVPETSASEAFDRLGTEPFDCVISDYEMPGMDGLEFLEQLREDYPDLPFILFTGKGSEEIASEAISAGVTDYLQKGTGADRYTVLANRVENAVRQYRSQRAVEATERKLSQLAERTDDVLFMVDGDWRELLFVNSAYEDIWGRPIEELRDDPRSVVDQIHPDDRSDVKESMRRLQNGEPDALEYRVQTGGGDYRWVHSEAKPIFDDAGNVDRITGFVRDVTERKTRERELQAQVMAMEAATDGIAILDENAEYVFMNEAHAEIYGFDDPERLLGESWRECYDDDDLSQFEGEIMPSLFETGHWKGEMTVTTADGRTIDQELTLTRLDDGRILCVVRDITEQKERERDLERYKTFVEEAIDIVGVVSEDGTVRYESPAVERILGHDPADLEGESAFEYIHPEDRQRVMERFSDLVSDDGQTTDRVQYRVRHADGSWRWLESQTSAQTDTALDGYVITSRDITERKERERELQRQNERLDEFASIVSHDLQSPLSVAQGRVELAREDCDSEHLDAIARVHERMEALIDDILTVSREGTVATEIEPVALAEMVDRCWQNVETADATLVTATERTIRADRGRLKQLLENLVRNAVEHGGGAVTVTVADLDDGFYVEDDGVGIPDDRREQVFDVGYSTSRDGTGFGLAIVEQVADVHGWDVAVTESSDGGVRFEITGVDVVS